MMLKEFGRDLKSLRESRNITIAEISSQTRINSKFIRYIEGGKFDFQPETYIRAFLREYARVLDENEHKILNDFEKAKSGFYSPRSKSKETVQAASAVKKAAVEPDKDENEEEPPDEMLFTSRVESEYTDFGEEKKPKKKWARKILIGSVIAAIIVGVVFLIDYLNRSSEGNNLNVKPKTFSEISDDYETKISRKKGADTVTSPQVVDDSLVLTVKTTKNIRVKVYLDENRVVEEELEPRDSITIKAKDQFRFSSTANSSVDLYLNGKYLTKPKDLTGLTIKNLIIKKDGIVVQQE